MSSSRIDVAPYGAAASALTAASRGAYTGPAIPEGALREALGSITGLDTAALTSGFSQASGDSRPGQLNDRVAPLVIKILGDIALGLVGGLVGDAVGDWVNRRKETKNLEDQAKDAADAVDTVVEDADHAMNEVLSRAVQLLDLLLKYLSGIDPTKFPNEFLAAVRCAAEVIDNAAGMIIGTCEQRDDIIEGCYEQLISEAEKICGAPAAELPPEVQECTKEIAPVEGPSSGASSTTPTGPAAKAEDCPPEPAPDPVKQPEAHPVPKPVPLPEPVEEDCPPEPEPEPAPVPDPVTTPSGLTPEVKPDPLPEPELTEEPELPAAPIEEEPIEPVDTEGEPEDEPEQSAGCGDSCSGILGLLGVGVALLALGALVECLSEMEVPAVDPTPEPVPEPAPAPAPAVAEAPSPTPAELAEVPEPTPPPKKIAFTEAQQMAASPPPAPEPTPPPPPAPTPAPMGTARKAGVW
ncbi:hypothetical protein [Corynebacterium sp. A21]|uniref:hypothetical protein n=1 Tax=Corynebacterium sp. A21 TaxID=3457318 RepID=UPI003FD2869E